MAWLEKRIVTPLDSVPIPGRLDLVGDVLAKQYGVEHPKGKKYPLIRFPSGLERELTPQKDNPSEAMLHIFGGLHLPYKTDRDTAYALSLQASEEFDGYQVAKRGTDALVVGNTYAKRSYILLFDNHTKELLDVDLNWNSQHKMDLLPGELRAALPKLYANEQLGMEAIAPIKFFTPDANWTWYPTEFDGDDLFFGLVAGHGVELGYFSLSELESVVGGLSLPIERDLYFSPTKLSDLSKQHSSFW
ncbi:MAG TPA: DUF2958 domain-containing protein [Aggregatilineales bacterium]|nr:DUF2958 domain-containing protein [Aggregatilineales bacterium]